MECVRPDGLGITLWSKHPLEDTEVRHLVLEDRASLWATMVQEDGRRVRFVGLHPTPPALKRDGDSKRYDSRIRDSELILVAKAAAADPSLPWLVAGDLNDVAWSRTTRLFVRLSGLRDARRGRSLMNTFPQRYPLLGYPLDHVFVSPTVSIASFDRIGVPGSDHFGLRVGLSVDRVRGEQVPQADSADRSIAHEMLDEGERDAHARNQASAEIRDRSD